MRLSELAEILRTDEPVVVPSPHAGRTCRDCRFWSRWLPNTGDCMRWAYLRQDASIASDDRAAFHEKWPMKSARMTSIDETCGGWEAPRSEEKI